MKLIHLYFPMHTENIEGIKIYDKIIGEGSHSKIQKCKFIYYNNDTNKTKPIYGAVKKILNIQEINIMEKIGKLKRFKENNNNIINSFCYLHRINTNDKYLITEYSELGDLSNFINNKNIIAKYEIKDTIIKGIINGLRFLHCNKVTHGDLKTNNIVIFKENDKYIPKIIDFGLSNYNSESPFQEISSEQKTYALFFKSPYTLKYKRVNDYRVIPKAYNDIYSLGIIIINIFEGKDMPVSGFSIDTIKDIYNNNINKKTFYAELKNLIEDFCYDDKYPEDYREIVKYCTDNIDIYKKRIIDNYFYLLNGEKI